MRRTRACVALAVVGGIGCGTGALPEEEVPLPDALTCASTSWSVVHTFAETSLVPSNLALRADVFYISIGDRGIVALPKAGGDEVLLTTETARNLWIEGDSIYFGKNDDKLWRLPLAGGAPAVVVDGMTAFVEPNYAVPADIALDASYFYWDLSPQAGPDTWTVWRAARAGGAAEKLADLPLRDPPYGWRTLTLTPDTLIVAVNTQNVAYAVPLSGGSMRPLPAPPARAYANMHAGTSAVGVLWVDESWPSGGGYPATHLSISAVGDVTATSPRPFWTAKPPYMRPWSRASWPDGNGGWLITGTEQLADGRTHASVWAVDRAGTAGTRLGCDPEEGYGPVWSTVVTPEAVYAIVTAYDRSSPRWMLVRIDRVPAPPTGA